MFYSASYGSLQAAVKGLLAKGLIVYEERVDNGRNKKIYTITEGGRAAFFAWMLGEIPAHKLEVTALAKVYFLGLVQDAEQKRQIVREILGKIEIVHGELSAMNDELGRLELPPELAATLKYQLKTLDYGLQSHVFARQWFQALLDEV